MQLDSSDIGFDAVRRMLTGFCFCSSIDSGEAVSLSFCRYHAGKNANCWNDSDIRLLGLVSDLGVEC
jgi:hypothetical protein